MERRILLAAMAAAGVCALLACVAIQERARRSPSALLALVGPHALYGYYPYPDPYAYDPYYPGYAAGYYGGGYPYYGGYQGYPYSGGYPYYAYDEDNAYQAYAAQEQYRQWADYAAQQQYELYLVEKRATTFDGLRWSSCISRRSPNDSKLR